MQIEPGNRYYYLYDQMTVIYNDKIIAMDTYFSSVNSYY